ncbi:OmpH family outer membrane protein [Lacinutrix salivirga]
MKNTILALFIILGVSSCQQQKMGYIDTGEVINAYQHKIDIEKKFDGKDEAFKKKTDSIGQAFQLEAQKFQMAAQKMSKTKAQENYQALGQKQQMLQQQMQFEQQQLTQEFQKEIDSVIINVKEFVKDYGKKNGYTYILGTSEGSASVLYGIDENNLTEEITKALNDAYKK